MIFQRYADLFEICWPVFWPWLWLQLSILTAQKAEDGRERLIMGTWWGKVYVLAVGDDPNAPPNAPFRPLRGSLDAAFRPLLAAKFPGDTPELAARTPPPPCPIQFKAPSLAALTLLQDKSRTPDPG